MKQYRIIKKEYKKAGIAFYSIECLITLQVKLYCAVFCTHTTSDSYNRIYTVGIKNPSYDLFWDTELNYLKYGIEYISDTEPSLDLS